MPKKGRNIYKRKDGRWEARYIKSYDKDGKINYGYVYAQTYHEVKEKQEKLSYSILTPEAAQGTSFCSISDKWLAMQKINVKESTFAKYTRIVNKYLDPYFNDICMENISAGIVEEYMFYLAKKGRLDGSGGLSGKTARDIISVLKAVIKYAVKNNIDIQYIPENIKIKKTAGNTKVFSKKEQEILTGYLLKDTDLAKLGVFLSLYTGIRIGELCALKWGNVNLEDNYIEITETMQRIQDFSGGSSKTKVITGKPKSETSRRIIPMPDFLPGVLKRFAGKKNEFVLSGDSKRYMEPRVMQIKFKNMLKDCGLPQVNFHILRHTFATRCIESGFEIKSLSEILGHSNVNITLKQYVHSSFDLKKNNMKKIGILM